MNPPQKLPGRVIAPSFYEYHATRVQSDLLYFQFATRSANPPVHPSPAVIEDPKRKLNFMAPSNSDDPLQQIRELERLRLFREDQTATDPGDLALGLGMFISSVLGAAHAPPPLRFLFDGPVHLGPAIFQGGGMGMGAGVGMVIP